MTCGVCSRFAEAKWRITSEPEEGKKKFAPKLRHCNIAQKYIPSETEKCDHFEPNNKFWCYTNNYWINVAACVSKYNKGYDDTCKGCKQHKEVVELHRARVFWQRKQDSLLNTEDSKPVLLKRRPQP